MKRCAKCKQHKPLDSFSKNMSMQDGKNPYCKSCISKYIKILWNKDPEKSRKLRRDYYSKNKDRILRQRSLRSTTQRWSPSPKFSYMRSKSKRRHVNVTITLEEYIRISSLPCHYCGLSLPRTGYGIDRKHNSLGYTFGNVVPCCWKCNKIKGNVLTYDEMIIVSKALREYKTKFCEKILKEVE